MQARARRAGESWEGEWEAGKWILEWSSSLCVGVMLSFPYAQISDSFDKGGFTD